MRYRGRPPLAAAGIILPPRNRFLGALQKQAGISVQPDKRIRPGAGFMQPFWRTSNGQRGKQPFELVPGVRYEISIR